MGSWVFKSFVVLLISIVIVAAALGFFWAINALDASKAPSTNAPRPAFFSLNPPVQKALETLNLCVVRREIARLEGDEEGLKKAEIDVAQALNLFEAVHAKLKETRYCEHLLPRDELFKVGDKDATVDQLRGLFAEIPPETSLNVVVRRGGLLMDVILRFKNAASLDSAAVDTPQRMKIPPVITHEVRKEFLSAPQPYQALHLTEEERKKAARLLDQGEIAPEDYLFLKQRVLDDAASAIKKKRDNLSTRLAELKEKLSDTYGPQHVILLQRDGSRVEGTLLASTNTAFEVQTPSGKLEVQRENLTKMLKGAQLKSELIFWLTRINIGPAVGEKALHWAKEWSLPLHQKIIGLHILLKDPAHEAARAAAESQSDALLTPPTSEPELRSYLERQGFALRDGRWYRKIPWSIKLDSLFDPLPFKVSYKNAGVLERPVNYTPSKDQDKKEETPDSPKERFIGAISSTEKTVGSLGFVSIEIEAPSEIASCRLKANGCVMTKSLLLTEDENLSRVTVIVEVEGSEPAEIYSIDNSKNSTFHDITKHVKGARRFTVKAQLDNLPDKYGVYARFLNSPPHMKDVFVVKGQVLTPAPEADKLWAARR